MAVDLSIIIPAYNEEVRIVSTLDSLKSYLAANRDQWKHSEVIVVSDGCSDATDEVIRKYQKNFPELQLVTYKDNQGKGYAIKQGVLASKGDIVLFTDADEATPITELDHCVAYILDDTADMVIASRRSEDANVIKKQPKLRKMLGNAFSIAVRTMLAIPFLDTQCGFKLFKGAIAREIFTKSECANFAIDIEIIHLALSKGYRIKETGVIWIDGDGSKVDPLRDGINMLLYTGKLSMKTKTEELKIKIIDVLKELLVCMKLMINPKNLWIYLPSIIAVASVYVAYAYNAEWFLGKGGEETLALILMGGTISLLFVATLKFRNIASLFLLVLAVNFLIRELDKTPITLPGIETFVMRTKSYIYIALGVMAAWGIWQEKKIIAFFYEFPLTKIMFLGVFSSYFISQLIARRLFKHIPILPNEHEYHIAFEEITENAAHIFFLVLASVILWYAFRKSKPSDAMHEES